MNAMPSLSRNSNQISLHGETAFGLRSGRCPETRRASGHTRQQMRDLKSLSKDLLLKSASVLSEVLNIRP